MSEQIAQISDDQFEDQVLKSSEPVLVDFWAEWCGPCKMIAPVLDELATELNGQLKIAKVDVDAESALAAQFGITAIPTLLLFKGGHVVEQLRGARSKRAIRDAVEPHL